MRRFATLTLSLLLAPNLARAEPPTRVWVFFTDHGRSPAQLEAELARREAELGPRTLARRSKVRTGELVDAHDLLPATAYVNAVERSGAKLRVQSRWLNAVSVDADAQTQRELAALPFVRGLHPVARAQGHTLEWSPAPQHANPEDYGLAWQQLTLLGVPDLHDCGLTGAGVLMGVQDTGFLLDHQAFANADVLAAHDFLNNDDIVGPEMGDVPEQHLHGTMVLSTIIGDDPGNFRGVAPGVQVILSKTEHQAIEDPFEEDAYVEGLEWIEGMGADLFTASLIYQQWYTIDDLDGASAVTTVAVEMAVGNGLIVFTAMGNTGPNPSTLGAPADSAGAISMGAVDVMSQLAPFSSRGPTFDGRIKPDVLASGWNVYAVDPATLDNYAVVSGTSFSTPMAAGIGALLLEAHPGLTPAEMADLLRSTGSHAGMPDNDWGYGIIDANAAYQQIKSEICDNAKDDDCDMLIDTLDPDCPAGDGDGDGDGDTGDGDGDGDGDSGDGDGDSGDGDGDSGDGDGDGDGGSESDGDESSTGSATETGGGIDEASGCTCDATRHPRGSAALPALVLGFTFVRRRRHRAEIALARTSSNP